MLTTIAGVCLCLCAEGRKEVLLVLDSSSTSAAAAGSAAASTRSDAKHYQSSLGGTSSRSRCFLFPLNLASRSCAVVGRHVRRASGRVTTTADRTGLGRLGETNPPAVRPVIHLIHPLCSRDVHVDRRSP